MLKIAGFIVSELDNVVTVLLKDLAGGSTINVALGEERKDILLKNTVPYGHKVAIKPIKKGEKVMKYGCTIGLATYDIEIGEHVHIQNIESIRGRGDLAKRG